MTVIFFRCGCLLLQFSQLDAYRWNEREDVTQGRSNFRRLFRHFLPELER